MKKFLKFLGVLVAIGACVAAVVYYLKVNGYLCCDDCDCDCDDCDCDDCECKECDDFEERDYVSIQPKSDDAACEEGCDCEKECDCEEKCECEE